MAVCLKRGPWQSAPCHFLLLHLEGSSTVKPLISPSTQHNAHTPFSSPWTSYATARDSLDWSDSPKTLDSLNSLDLPDSLDALNSLNTLDALNSLNSLTSHPQGQAAAPPVVAAPGTLTYEYRLWEVGGQPPDAWTPVTDIAAVDENVNGTGVAVTHVTVTAAGDGVYGFQARVAGIESGLGVGVGVFRGVSCVWVMCVFRVCVCVLCVCVCVFRVRVNARQAACVDFRVACVPARPLLLKSRPNPPCTITQSSLWLTSMCTTPFLAHIPILRTANSTHTPETHTLHTKLQSTKWVLA